MTKANSHQSIFSDVNTWSNFGVRLHLSRWFTDLLTADGAVRKTSAKNRLDYCNLIEWHVSLMVKKCAIPITMKLYNIKNQKYIVYSLHKLTIFTTEWKDNTTAQNMADSTPVVYLNFDAMYVISQPTDLSPERYRILVDWYCGIKDARYKIWSIAKLCLNENFPFVCQ